MPAKKGDYYNEETPKYNVKERQNISIVKDIMKDKEAYKEFLTNVMIHVTGSVKLDKLYLADSTYETIVTASDEAYGFLLVEDKSLMWREVLRRRRRPSFGGQSGAGGKSLGVKKEVFITDKYGDSFTIWSNGGVLSPGNRKGWSDEGILRFNEYRTLITYFRKTTYGENAMKEQKTNWTQSLLVANRKRRSDMMESESTEVPRRERIICSQEEWD